jgi:hypothetical protein
MLQNEQPNARALRERGDGIPHQLVVCDSPEDNAIFRNGVSSSMCPLTVDEMLGEVASVNSSRPFCRRKLALGRCKMAYR